MHQRERCHDVLPARFQPLLERTLALHPVLNPQPESASSWGSPSWFSDRREVGTAAVAEPKVSVSGGVARHAAREPAMSPESSSLSRRLLAMGVSLGLLYGLCEGAESFFLSLYAQGRSWQTGNSVAALLFMPTFYLLAYL